MVYYATKDQLRTYAAELGSVQAGALRKSAELRSAAGSTFLSHSSKDDDLVTGAIRVLEGHGARVYVDEIDPAMPPYTSCETAALLKSRIRDTRRFVLLASSNSKDSRWVPWELGIADSLKGTEKIALFPALDNGNDRTWTSWEYLGLYDRIVFGNIKGRSESLWMVLDEKNFTAVPLRDWLDGA